MNDLADVIKFFGKVGLGLVLVGWLLWVGAAMIQDPCSRPWDTSCKEQAERDSTNREAFEKAQRLQRLAAELCWREEHDNPGATIVYSDATQKCEVHR